MLCGKKSRDEYNGQRITIEDLNEDDKFDGYAFEASYAKAQLAKGKMYKD